MNKRQKEMLQDLIDNKNNQIKELKERINKTIKILEYEPFLYKTELAIVTLKGKEITDPVLKIFVDEMFEDRILDKIYEEKILSDNND